MKLELGRGDDAAKLGVGERLVADEVDTRNLGFRPFANFEHQVDPVVVELDDLSVNLGGVVALPAVDVEDALHISLHASTGIERPRLELHFLGQRVGLDLGVAFEGHAIDYRVFHNRDDHDAALQVQVHVLE